MLDDAGQLAAPMLDYEHEGPHRVAAVYDALTDTSLDLPPVFDHVEQGAEYPYIVLGDVTHVAWDTDDSIGTEATITLHVWSVQRGRKEAKEIIGEIYGVLHRAELYVDGFETVTIDFEYSEVMLDPDGVTYHGVCRYRALIESE
jgi:hypothetical protein